MITKSSAAPLRKGPSRRREDDCRLQEGIYFRSGRRPGRCYRLLLLNIGPGASREEAKDAIARVWEKLREVREKRQKLLAELRPPGATAGPDRDEGDLTCLLGFGASLFTRYPAMRGPRELGRLGRGERPFPSVPWVPVAERAEGEADLALQFIAESELAVNTAAVEVWMLIRTERLKLEVVALHAGYNREDGRSWLDFHDGISNIERGRRREAIETKVAGSTPEDPPAWMDGGTYMGFLRMAIDLEMWRAFSLHEQKTYVGRDLESGCPLAQIDGRSSRVLEGSNRLGPGSAAYRNPPRPSLDEDNLAPFSHIHRANLNRNHSRARIEDTDNRIFRQGYEFLEPLAGGRLRPGLNFVSFQRRLSCLTNILDIGPWLGSANFGGRDSPPVLLSLIGGGYYAVPPEERPFPGAGLF